jgi:hypothetical protein
MCHVRQACAEALRVHSHDAAKASSRLCGVEGNATKDAMIHSGPIL